MIKAWYAHSSRSSHTSDSAADHSKSGESGYAKPPFSDIPPDENEVLYARRLVAQRGLYGVKKNDMAVDLAKLSLWLVTLAKNCWREDWPTRTPNRGERPASGRRSPAV